MFSNNCNYDAIIEKDKISQLIPLVVSEEMSFSKKAFGKYKLDKVVKIYYLKYRLNWEKIFLK